MATLRPLTVVTAALISIAAAPAPMNLATGKPYLAADDVPAGVYDVVSKETLVRYEVLHFGYSGYWGTFAGAVGTLAVDPKNLAATKLDVKVPIWTVETTNKELNGELFSDEFFDAETHPWMRFVSTSVVRTGDNTAKVAGTLTMHNISRPVTLDVTFIGGGPAPSGFGENETIIGFRAEGRILRSDFGLGKYVPVVSDETRIVISSSLKKR